MTSYDVTIIDAERTEELLGAYSNIKYYSLKADINGICVELFCGNKDFTDMLSDNFYHMSDHVRSHVFCFGSRSNEKHARGHRNGWNESSLAKIRTWVRRSRVSND